MPIPMYGVSGGAAIVLIVLLSVLVIAGIVLSIIWALAYLRGDPRKKDSFLGKLFNFDYFIIEKVLQVFYVFNVVGIIAVCIAFILIAIFSGNFIVAIGGIVGAAVLFVVYQLFVRMLYEAVMLAIRQANDVRSIRDMIAQIPAVKEAGVPLDSYSGFVDTLPSNVQAKINQVADKVVDSADDMSAKAQGKIGEKMNADTWDCSCGKKRNKGAFCPACGSGRPQVPSE